ncbi:MAG: head GIN domain-containing protein [Bacteroidota bacterium]
MKKLKTFLFLMTGVLLGQLGFAQQTRDVPVGTFQKLTLQGSIQAELVHGDKAQVKIIGSEEDIDEVSIITTGNELAIKTKSLDFSNHDNKNRKRIKVIVTFDALSQLHTGRGAEVKVKTVVMADDLEVEAHSGSIVTMDVLATNLRVEVGEGALATLSGKATTQKTLVSTGGQLNAKNLSSETVNIRTNTGGNAEVAASKSLEASAGTGGNIRYKGNPAKSDINTSLGGSISQLR